MPLPKHVRSLGELVGRSWADIEPLVGKPSTGHVTPNGGRSGQWDGDQWAVSIDAMGVIEEVRVRKRGELELGWRLRSLGNILGMSRSSIEHTLGPPNAVSTAAEYSLLQWQRPGYHIALKFDQGGACLGITHQHSHRTL